MQKMIEKIMIEMGREERWDEGIGRNWRWRGWWGEEERRREDILTCTCRSVAIPASVSLTR